MTFGLAVLRHSPQDFWSLTLPELIAAIGNRSASSAPPSAIDLHALLQRFPDDAP